MGFEPFVQHQNFKPTHLLAGVNVFIYGPGLSRDVTPVANVYGKERPYKLTYRIVDQYLIVNQLSAYIYISTCANN